MRLTLLLSLAIPLSVLAGERAEFTEQTLFRAGQDGYHTYRIPALITTNRGTVLAFAEGRKDSQGDSGNIDIVLRRSRDGGQTWSPLQVVADQGDDTIGNPTPVVDRRTGRILLLLTANSVSNSRARTVWISSSDDEGVTWSTPREITSSAKKPDWNWYATGPGNGTQLRDGRILIPCDHTVAGSETMYAHVIFSDDGGRTWQVGGSAGGGTDESAVFERSDGSLMFNIRSARDAQGNARKRRAVAVSHDRGATWSPLTWDETLIEPVCQASILRYPRKKGVVLFSNPADETRRVRMTVRASLDEARTWRSARVLHEGPSGYSSLAVLQDGTVMCLYERGTANFRETVTLARFPLAWLE